MLYEGKGRNGRGDVAREAPGERLLCCVFRGWHEVNNWRRGQGAQGLKVGRGGDALESSTEMGKDVADMQLGVFWGHGQALSVSLSGDMNYLDVSSSGISTTKKVQAPSSPVSCLTVAHSEIVIGCNDGTCFHQKGAEWTKIARGPP